MSNKEGGKGRPLNQFISAKDRIVRRPDSHTKRGELFGVTESPRGLKPSDAKKGHKEGVVRPLVDEKLHVNEGLTVHFELQSPDSDTSVEL